MIENSLELPAREQRPRENGQTMVIDNGIPKQLFADIIESCGEYIDLVKFGWGTAIVTPGIDYKMRVLRQSGIDYMFGGTLFEKYLVQDRFDDFRELCQSSRCRVVEVSNGTIDLGHEDKTKFISKLVDDFVVLSEVGFKDSERSEMFAPSQWVSCIERDLEAGARSVILEARESGTSGICRPDGEVRFGLIEDILNTPGMDPSRLIFEAPVKDLQTYFIRRVGSNVNLGNISVHDVLSVETLRLGLRADTLLHCS